LDLPDGISSGRGRNTRDPNVGVPQRDDERSSIGEGKSGKIAVEIGLDPSDDGSLFAYISWAV
jgi:hypothetical protein